MHAFEGPKGTRFFHNGDFSGTIRITRPTGHLDGFAEIEVPSDDILELVAAYIRLQKISALESATTEELLGAWRER